MSKYSEKELVKLNLILETSLKFKSNHKWTI